MKKDMAGSAMKSKMDSFEKSDRDIEQRGVKEGSKKDKKYDMAQIRKLGDRKM